MKIEDLKKEFITLKKKKKSAEGVSLTRKN